VSPYYHPNDPTTPVYDGGVVVVASGGDSCAGGTISRTTTLFLKCDPSKTQLPFVGDRNCFASPPQCPVVNETTACFYNMQISWAGFCPTIISAPPRPTSVNLIWGSVYFHSGAAGTKATVVTSDFAPFLQLTGWSCTSISKLHQQLRDQLQQQEKSLVLCPGAQLALCSGPTPTQTSVTSRGLYSVDVTGSTVDGCGKVSGQLYANQFYATKCQSAISSVTATSPAYFSNLSNSTTMLVVCNRLSSSVPIFTVQPTRTVCDYC
jgi:hypothetical protein